MFQRFSTPIVVAALVLSLAGTAFGQAKVDLAGKDTSGLKLTLSGAMDIDYVYRDSVVQELRTGAAWAAGGVASTDSTNFWTGKFTVRMDVDLADKVSAVLEMENLRYMGGATEPLGDDDSGVLFEQAYVKFSDLINEGFSATLGVQDVKIDARGKGNPFFIDLTESESAWQGTGSLVPQKFAGYQEPVGLSFNYKAKDAPWGLLFGTYTVNELGGTGDDEDVYLLDLSYDLPASAGKGSVLNLLASLFNGMGSDATVYTLGGELALNELAGAGLDLFGGAYFQFGDAGQDATGDAIDASGDAFTIGGRYTFAAGGKPWIELAYWAISGDNDAADGDEDRFLSYENVDQFLVIENDTFGLDIDSGYNAIKLSGGVLFDVGGKKENLNMTMNLGFFRFDEDLPSNEDDLGTEFDLGLAYMFSKNVTLDFNAGLLFGADAVEDYTFDDDNDARIFTLGTNVTF